MSELIVGIDLGTTNSALAWLDDEGTPRIVPIDGQPTMPSCVGLDADGKLLVGQAAKNQLVAAPESTVLSVKRLMGTSEKVTLGDKEFSPEEISSFILRRLKDEGEKQLGQPIRKAVITVPAYFDEHQRRATQNAGDLAGLEVVRIVNEPTAAALAYEAGHEGDRRLLVYDLGGGTFDVSVVVVENGVVEVKASHGDTHLGGDDFDDLLVRHAEECFHEEHGETLRNDLKTKRRLRVALERAKCRLSDEPVTRVREEFIDGERHLDLEIDRDTYEGLISKYISKTLDCISHSLRDAHLLPSDIDLVMLVGGSTRTPLVHRMLKERMKLDPRFEIDPDLIVAMGAAIQGGIIAGRQSRSILVDITAHSFGTSSYDTRDGEFTMVYIPIIPRNTPLPVTKSDMFYTLHENQEKVMVEVYEGEDPEPAKNTFLGDFRIEGLSKGPAGNPIIATFSLDLNGILHVTAREKKSGLSKSITIDTRNRKESIDLERARNRLAEFYDDGDFDDEAFDDEDETDAIIDVGDVAGSPSTGAPATASKEETLTTARDLKKRAEALLELDIDESDAGELRNLLHDSGAAISAQSWEKLAGLNDRLSDLLFYLED